MRMMTMMSFFSLEFEVPDEEEEGGGDGKEKEKRRGNNGADSEEETVKYDVPHKPPCFYWINCVSGEVGFSR
ncbi:hypothetical protein NC653_039750 [Populus alba x Populus x berolinensis]|uniref:Uncharacterized protein n=1 Tax=Populus alba x Populus x berolinensis TaxID=444605 RepID=A0AAD6LBY6_9ROSI|nr:hypothetical protein NC653_039750 [Populus alba x Populus x berolinensis]